MLEWRFHENNLSIGYKKTCEKLQYFSEDSLFLLYKSKVRKDLHTPSLHFKYKISNFILHIATYTNFIEK
jgi:hypothetical protein